MVPVTGREQWCCHFGQLEERWCRPKSREGRKSKRVSLCRVVCDIHV